MNITCISIMFLPNGGPAKVYVYTDLPMPFQGLASPEALSMHFEAPTTTVEEYVKTQFPGVPYEVKDYRRVRLKFSGDTGQET